MNGRMTKILRAIRDGECNASYSGLTDSDGNLDFDNLGIGIYILYVNDNRYGEVCSALLISCDSFSHFPFSFSSVGWDPFYREYDPCLCEVTATLELKYYDANQSETIPIMATDKEYDVVMQDETGYMVDNAPHQISINNLDYGNTTYDITHTDSYSLRLLIAGDEIMPGETCFDEDGNQFTYYFTDSEGNHIDTIDITSENDGQSIDVYIELIYYDLPADF